MTYCSVCGISYENADRVCAGCGNELEKGSEQVTMDYSLNADTAVLNRTPISDFDVSGHAGQDQESQLGKGLVKPYSVELEIDGFHFKYDKPVRNFAKHESIKEKIAEFRVTCPDWEPALPEKPRFDLAHEDFEELRVPENIIQEPVFRVENSSAETSWRETSGEVKNDPGQEDNEITVIEPVDTIPAAGPGQAEDIQIPIEVKDEESLPDQEMAMDGETLTEVRDPVLEIGLDSELVPGNELPEPELEIHEEKVIVWEDSQHWFGIPLTNQYRISNRSLQIIDRLARKFSEVDLSLISEVKLQQSWLDRILKTGDLTVFVKHLPDTGLKLSGVRDPEKVRHLLEEQIKL